MLVVKPNKRRMRQFRDSPAENALTARSGPRPAIRSRWQGTILALGVAGIVALGFIAFAEHIRF